VEVMERPMTKASLEPLPKNIVGWGRLLLFVEVQGLPHVLIILT
jgi:hypothetical protein